MSSGHRSARASFGSASHALAATMQRCPAQTCATPHVRHSITQVFSRTVASWLENRMALLHRVEGHETHSSMVDSTSQLLIRNTDSAFDSMRPTWWSESRSTSHCCCNAHASCCLGSMLLRKRLDPPVDGVPRGRSG